MNPTNADADSLRAAIRASLAPAAGMQAEAAAAIVLTTLQAMSGRLVPVIGARGTEALYHRALHLTAMTFSWLIPPGNHPSSREPLAQLEQCLATQEAGVATAAGYTLLTTFVGLLEGLVGESLTCRLLSPVWADASNAVQEHEHEP